MKHCLFTLVWLFLAVLPANARKTFIADDTARLLAGLPVTSSPLGRLCATSVWMEHAQALDRSFHSLEAGQLSKVHAWSQQHLGSARSSRSPMFYLFSGPDALYAQTFFPNAGTYVLAGLEPAGTPPDLSRLSADAFAKNLAQVRNSLSSILQFSFFKTKDMKEDFSTAELGGIMPILYVFLARANRQIQKVEMVSLDSTGAFTESTAKGTTSGVKITLNSKAWKRQTLYYFSTNLADDAIKANPGFLRFCQSLGRGNSLVKAASYLMHHHSFSTARDFLLTHSATLVEDDSGIPIKQFAPANWSVRYFGSYTGPIDLFKDYYQPELAEKYRASPAQALPFSFGYRWHPKESSLILATSKL